MTISEEQKISKYMSYLLRHNASEMGVELEDGGWAPVCVLIRAVQNKYRIMFNIADLDFIVANDSKGRYSYNEDRTKIRANQGHSISVKMDYRVEIPPIVLYHGTATRFKDNIIKNGLKPMTRTHVHLSSNIETARKVGERHGQLLLYGVDTQAMLRDGYQFMVSTNGVWLVDKVPYKYLKELTDL